MPRAARRRRLSRSSEFERVYRHGRSKANRFLVLYAFPRDGSAGADASPDARSTPSVGGGSTVRVADGSAGSGSVDAGAEPRLGLSVSRRVGGAVDRARVKRTLREAFRAHAGGLPAGADYVIVARPPARELAEREGTAGIERELSELIAALGGGGHRSRAAGGTDAGGDAGSAGRSGADTGSDAADDGDPGAAGETA